MFIVIKMVYSNVRLTSQRGSSFNIFVFHDILVQWRSKHKSVNITIQFLPEQKE